MRQPIPLLIAVALVSTPAALAQTPAEVDATKRVYVLPIEGAIAPGTRDFVDRAVGQALRQRGQVLVVEIDTPGGEIESLEEIVDRLEEASEGGMRTVAFVTDWAASAGALIAIACEDLYLRPGSAIGAAEPLMIDITGKVMPGGEKMVSFLSAQFKAWAEKRGRPANLAMAMVDVDLEVWEVFLDRGEGEERLFLTPDEIYERFGIRGSFFEQVKEQIRQFPETIKKLMEEGHPPRHFYDREAQEVDEGMVRITKPVTVPGKLLTLTAEEAVEYGFAEGLVDDRESLLERVDASDARVIELQPTWADGIVGFLTHPMVSALLLVIGLIGIAIELWVPGFGAPGIVGLSALAVFFVSHWVVGLADVLDLVLIVLGLVLLAVEIFVLPGFGVAGVSGIILLLAGLILALQDFTVPRDAVDLQIVARNLFYVVTAMGAAVLLFFASMRYLPETKAFRSMTIEAEMRASEGYTVARPERNALVGKRGRSTCPLRPAGMAQVGDELLDVVTRGEFIEAGTEVEVVDVRANRILVQAVAEGGGGPA